MSFPSFANLCHFFASLPQSKDFSRCSSLNCFRIDMFGLEQKNCQIISRQICQSTSKLHTGPCQSIAERDVNYFALSKRFAVVWCCCFIVQWEFIVLNPVLLSLTNCAAIRVFRIKALLTLSNKVEKCLWDEAWLTF